MFCKDSTELECTPFYCHVVSLHVELSMAKVLYALLSSLHDASPLHKHHDASAIITAAFAASV